MMNTEQLATRNSQLATEPRHSDFGQMTCKWRISDFAAPRRAFTLIEMLIVITIIILLFGMFFLGANQMFGSNKVGLTKSILQTAISLYSEYDQATHSVTNPPITYPQPPYLPPSANPSKPDYVSIYQVPLQTTPSRSANFWTGWAEIFPQQTSSNVNYTATTYLPDGLINKQYLQAKVAGSMSGDYSSFVRVPQFLQDTVSVMYTLAAVPNNQKILAGLPAGETVSAISFLGISPTSTRAPITLPLAPTAGQTPTVVVSPSLILDAWNNPVIFVPAQGIIGVKAPANTSDTYIAPSGTQIYKRGDRVVYQGLFYTWINSKSSNDPTLTSGANPPLPVVAGGVVAMPDPNGNWGGLCSPDIKPFFASAGPDGDLSTGDDNVYSFQ